MRKITKKDYINHFIGREDIYLESYKKEGNIIDQLDRHLSGETRIGSYGTYQSKRLRDKERGNYRRRYLIVDIDRHYKNNDKKIPYSKEELEIELKKVEEKIEIILSRCREFFLVDHSCVIKERSPHGFHLWIILKKDTLLKNAVIYREYVQSKIETFLKEDVEIFPKTKLPRVKNPGLGFAVHLPNQNTLVPDVIKELDLKPLLEKYKKFLLKQKVNHKKITKIKIEKKVKKFKQEIRKGKWKKIKFNSKKLEDYRNDFNKDKCVRNFLNGQQLNGENGNLMRVQCVMRLNRDNFIKEKIIQAFWSQLDFDYDITSYRVNIIADIYSTYPSCKTVYKLGFCDPECIKNKVWKEKLEKKEKYPQEIQGFKGLHSKIKDLIKKPKISFLVKTTRSGTTTSVIIQSIVAKKNLLMIAPTKKIYNDTVREAIEIGIKDNFFTVFETPKIFRIQSNKEGCEKIKEELNKHPELEPFDFLLKGNCEKCSKNNNCKYYKFTQNIEDYGLIYMTTSKLKALIQSAGQSGKSKKLLDDLIKWSDVIFIDEFNHLIQMNVNSIIIDGENPYNQNPVNFLSDCKYILSKIKQKDKRLTTSNFYEILDDFITYIEIHVKSINIITPKNEIFVEEFESLFPEKRLELLQKNNEWVNSFGRLVNYCKKLGDRNVRLLLDLFFALHNEKLYLQRFFPKNSLPRIEIRWFENPLPIFDLINSLEKEKTILITDAVEPNIDLKKLMKKNITTLRTS